MIAREKLGWALHGTTLRVTHVDEPCSRWFRPLTLNEYAQWCAIQTGHSDALSIKYEITRCRRHDLASHRTQHMPDFDDIGTITREEYRRR